MKKLCFVFAIVAVLIGMNLSAAVAYQQSTAKTEMMYFQLRYKTPYGVYKRDADGNIVKNAKGSPIIVFKAVEIREHVIIRFNANAGTRSCEYATFDGTLDQDGKKNIVWKSLRPYSFVKLPMDDGGSLIVFSFSWTFTDRGVGVTPATCKIVSSFTTSPNGYMAPQTEKEWNGRNIFYGGAGTFTGYSDGLDTAAWGEVEDMTYAESYAKLPVVGSATFSHYGSGLTHANMRKILEQNLNRDIK